MHAQHNDDGLVETFGVDVWMTDAQEQTRNSVGEGKRLSPAKERLSA
jgi:hypothetical protein